MNKIEFSKKDTVVFNLYLQQQYIDSDTPSEFLQQCCELKRKCDAARLRNIYLQRWNSEQSENIPLSNTPAAEFHHLFKPSNPYEIGYDTIIQFSDIGIANRNIVVKDNGEVNPNTSNLYRLLFSETVTRYPIKNILILGICVDSVVLENLKNYKNLYPEINFYVLSDIFLSTTYQFNNGENDFSINLVSF